MNTEQPFENAPLCLALSAEYGVICTKPAGHAEPHGSKRLAYASSWTLTWDEPT